MTIREIETITTGSFWNRKSEQRVGKIIQKDGFWRKITATHGNEVTRGRTRLDGSTHHLSISVTPNIQDATKDMVTIAGDIHNCFSCRPKTLVGPQINAAPLLEGLLRWDLN